MLKSKCLKKKSVGIVIASMFVFSCEGYQQLLSPNQESEISNINVDSSQIDRDLEEANGLLEKLNNMKVKIQSKEFIVPVAIVSTAFIASAVGFATGRKYQANPLRNVKKSTIDDLNTILRRQNGDLRKSISELFSVYRKGYSGSLNDAENFGKTNELIIKLEDSLNSIANGSDSFLANQAHTYYEFKQKFKKLKKMKKSMTVSQSEKFSVLEKMVERSDVFFKSFEDHLKATDEIITTLGDKANRINLQEYSVRIPKQKRAYNGSILNYSGQKFLFYRFDAKPFSYYYYPKGNSKIMVVKLDENFKPISKPKAVIQVSNKQYKFYNPEDPRVHVIDGQIHLSFNDDIKEGFMNLDKNRKMRKAILDFDGEDFRIKQLDTFDSPNKLKMEKNWAPFVHNGDTYFIYSMYPLEVYKFDESTRMLSKVKSRIPPEIDKKLKQWKENFGAPRGGTNLVKDGDGFVGLFHSSKNLENAPVDSWQPKVYVNSFFKLKVTDDEVVEIVDIAQKPLRSEKYQEGSNIIFASGLSKEGDNYLVSGGVDDRYNFVWKLKSKDINAGFDDSLSGSLRK